jgi:hypothetical protein
MMSDAKTLTHFATVISSESVRQGNIQAAQKTFNAGGAYSTLSAAVKVEELAHQRRVLASCILNGIQPSVAIQALRELGTGGI